MTATTMTTTNRDSSRHNVRGLTSYGQKWLVTLVLTMAVQCPPVAIAIMLYHTLKYYRI